MKSVLIKGRKHIMKLNRNIPLTIILIFALLVIIGCGGYGSNGGSGALVSSNESSADNPSPPNDPPAEEPAPAELKSVQLQWEAPTANENGSSLNDLAGYKVYYGPGSQQYTKSANIGKYTSTRISSLNAGLWCFAITAYDYTGNESTLSGEEEVCATL